MNVCNVSGCEAPVKASGLCARHHQRLMRHGDVHTLIHANREQTLSALDDGLRAETDECVIWPYGRAANGYAYIRWEGKASLVHRVVCEEVYGPPPTDKSEAAHSCGNGHLGCYNKNHLRWASTKENAHDRITHGTAGRGVPKLSSRGARNRNAKLTEDGVLKIRALAAVQSHSEIARAFGVHHSAINRIVARRTWGWLP